MIDRSINHHETQPCNSAGNGENPQFSRRKFLETLGAAGVIGATAICLGEATKTLLTSGLPSGTLNEAKGNIEWGKGDIEWGKGIAQRALNQVVHALDRIFNSTQIFEEEAKKPLQLAPWDGEGIAPQTLYEEGLILNDNISCERTIVFVPTVPDPNSPLNIRSGSLHWRSSNYEITSLSDPNPTFLSEITASLPNVDVSYLKTVGDIGDVAANYPNRIRIYTGTHNHDTRTSVIDLSSKSGFHVETRIGGGNTQTGVDPTTLFLVQNHINKVTKPFQ